MGGAAMRRVAITGAGTINALGRGVEATMAAMRAGRSAIGPLDIAGVERLTVRVGAQVTGYDPEAEFSRAELALYDRTTQFALIAGAEALAQAGLAGPLGDRAGVIMGTSGGGLGTIDDNYRAVYGEGKNRVPPFTVPRLMPSAAASHLSMRHGLTGPSFTVSSACASSNHALAQAMALIRAGSADVMLAGGAEAMLVFGGVKAWEGLRVMAPDTCRPFSAGRKGMVQGEGAGVFVLEALDRARARGAPVLAELAGAGMSADAGDIVQPSQAGAVRAMRAALADADLAPEEIGYINAHGTGTKANDATEAAAIAELFSAPPPVSATKALHGHAIGATGAIELVACLMALGEGMLAPTANFLAPDPDCPLDVVPNTARAASVQAVLSNAFAFGGLNAVLALKAG
jgi:nodulation protein E